jgi:hypothetical protein
MLVRPNGQLTLNFPTSDRGYETIIVKELLETVNEKTVPMGLELRTEVKSESMNEAFLRGTSLADGLASFITLTTGVGMSVPKTSLCYEITPDKAHREFLQFMDNISFLNVAGKTIPHEQLIETIDRFYKLNDSKKSERIVRAIRWYRWGTSSSDPFDRFVGYWIGLEAVNKPLQEKLGVSDDTTTTCPKCAHKWTAFPTVSGIKNFVLQYFENGEELYSQLHTLRNNLVHSNLPLDALANKINELNNELSRILYAAIHFLLDIQPPWNFPKEIVVNASAPRLAAYGDLECEKVEDAFLDGVDPHLESDHSLVQLNRVDGKVTMTGTSNLKARIGTKARLNLHGLRVYGEGKGELKINEISIIRAS